jgi:hypothetical protein
MYIHMHTHIYIQIHIYVHILYLPQLLRLFLGPYELSHLNVDVNMRSALIVVISHTEFHHSCQIKICMFQIQHIYKYR